MALGVMEGDVEALKEGFGREVKVLEELERDVECSKGVLGRLGVEAVGMKAE